MLDSIARRGIEFSTVLMDSWSAATALMTRLMKAEKLFYCPIKRHRQVDESGGTAPYRAVETLEWTAQEQEGGKTVAPQRICRSAALETVPGRGFY